MYDFKITHISKKFENSLHRLRTQYYKGWHYLNGPKNNENFEDDEYYYDEDSNENYKNNVYRRMILYQKLKYMPNEIKLLFDKRTPGLIRDFMRLIKNCYVDCNDESIIKRAGWYWDD
ncbi:MAG: hypothetical protein Gaeavirus1_38 [Gaeavirus sp.]|uniref:Uncharacterized protein n=1 Tax=Gaeavirus sp. TaxID=2487767 RepID=A0A3G5A134_9VIRU|nr:MAG: hypothetical protein Gaeavirus1_38 [Gaeavirus sp.]